MLPGFLHRLLAEIRLLVEKPKYSNVLASKSFRIHSPPAKPNCTAWLGGQTWHFYHSNLSIQHSWIIISVCLNTLIIPVSTLLHRCYIWGSSGHPGQQVCVTGLLQPDGSHSRLVLPELPSSRVPVRSRKDPSSTHEESLFHREVDCDIHTVYFMYPTEHRTYLSVTYCCVSATDSFRC